MAIFADRADAGAQLARDLQRFAGTGAVVLGIPRGGVVVAAAVARALALPLGVAVVRKLGSPSNEEFAIGAIADGVRVVNPEAIRSGAVTPEQLAFVEDLERVELNRRLRVFGAAASLAVAGRAAIVVDDGVATGATLLAACHAVRARGAARIVAAVPVAPSDFRPDGVDEYVCPHRERDFWAVGQFYADFTQTTDAEVEALLNRGGDASAGSATERDH